MLLLAEKSHNSVFLVYGLLTDTRNRYYTLTMVTTLSLTGMKKDLAHAVVTARCTLGQRIMYEWTQCLEVSPTGESPIV